MKRFYIYLFLPVVLFICFFTVVIASDDVHIPDVKSYVYVYDEADMIDDETEAVLNDIMYDLEKETTAEIAVVSYVNSDISLERYANKLFNTLGIGNASKNNGVLLLMQKEGNHVRLEIGSGIDDDVISDSIAGDILDKYYVPYRDKDTSKAALLTTKAVASNLYYYYGIENELTEEFKPMISKKRFRIPDKVYPYLIFGGLGLYIGAGLLIEPIRKRKWKKTHGGSLRGYDLTYHSHDSSSSSDSGFFGDFGGGSSDGGGASR